MCLYWHTVCVRWLTLSWLRGLFRGIGRRERGERERGERERERESERRQGGGEGDIKYSVTDMLAYRHLGVKTHTVFNIVVIGYSEGRVSFLSSRNE